MALEVAIKKRFEKFKLDVAFTAEHGVTGLLGASGCGKSMTLKCIAGIETPDEGRIVLDGRTLFDRERHINLPPQQRRVGYLFQHYALFPNMTVAQNIAAGVREGSRAERAERAAGMIRTFYLEGLEGKRPRQLSGGQQQRVALARILASAPQVLLLDEPFSALDSYLKWQVELELMDLLEAFPGTTLFVTHSRDEVYRLCQDVCVLDHGRSEPLQPVRTLFEAPTTLPACLLSGCKNISQAKKLPNGQVETVDWGVTLAAGRPVPEDLTYVAVRSHHLRVVDVPGENVIPCQVERVVEDVFSTVLLCTTPGGVAGLSRLRVELPKGTLQDVGTQVLLRIPPASLLLLTSGGRGSGV
ncbi:MAG: ATP-binding cassette domain-containing protein [Oscillospiraceae bacterium]|nr:ATP-binding cassette domain-containing protein [Oscillospiraceae bacterium]